MNFLAMQEQLGSVDSLTTELITEYLATSIALGVLLMIVAVWAGRILSDKITSEDIKKNPSLANANSTKMRMRYTELILGSANVLFLCVGMTGIMILVANNLARAFAIGAAIAIVRFRIKFDAKGLGSSFLFALIVGMACGVGRLYTAAGIALIYSLLQIILIGLVTITDTKKFD